MFKSDLNFRIFEFPETKYIFELSVRRGFEPICTSWVSDVIITFQSDKNHVVRYIRKKVSETGVQLTEDVWAGRGGPLPGPKSQLPGTPPMGIYEPMECTHSLQ